MPKPSSARAQDAGDILDRAGEEIHWRLVNAFWRGELHGRLIWAKNGRALGVRLPKQVRADLERIAQTARWQRKRVRPARS